MTGCSFDCTGKDQRAYRVSMSQRVVVACADHRAYLEREGVRLIEVERRLGAVPVERERRRFVPRWMGRLTNRDETAGVTR